MRSTNLHCWRSRLSHAVPVLSGHSDEHSLHRPCTRRFDYGRRAAFGAGRRPYPNGPYVLAAFAPGCSPRAQAQPALLGLGGGGTFDEVRATNSCPDGNAEFTRFRAGEPSTSRTTSRSSDIVELLSRPDSGHRWHTAPRLRPSTSAFNTDRGPLQAKARPARSAFSHLDRRRNCGVGGARARSPLFAGSGRRVESTSPRTTAGATTRPRIALAKARRLLCRVGLFGRAACCVFACFYNENELGREGLHRALPRCGKRRSASRRSLCRWNSRRIRCARGSGAVGRRPRGLDRRATTMPRPSRHDDEEQPAELRTLGQRGLREDCWTQPRGESDPAKRRDTLQRAESLMLNDYPLLPVYYYVTRRLVQPRVARAGDQPDEPDLLKVLPARK